MSIEKAQKCYEKKLAKIKKNRQIEQTEIDKLQKSLNERYDKKEAKLKEKYNYLFISKKQEKLEEENNTNSLEESQTSSVVKEDVVENKEIKEPKTKKSVKKEENTSIKKQVKEKEDKKEIKKSSKTEEKNEDKVEEKNENKVENEEDTEKEIKQRKSLYRVIYDKEDRKWIIKKDGNEKITKKVNTKKEALEIVERLCEKQNLKMVVHKKDGKFQKLNNIKKSSN